MFNDIFIWINRFKNAGLLGFCFLLFESFLLQVGESNTFAKVEQCIDSKKEVLYFQGAKKDLLKIKYKSLEKIKPEILIVGSSRVNTFRFNMFKPYSFYNFSNLINDFSNTIGLINSLDSLTTPKYIFVLVEPFYFREGHSHFDTTTVNVDKFDKDKAYNDNFATVDFMIKLNKHYLRTPHWENIGLKAISKNRGFRPIDGSCYWGNLCLISKEKNIERQKYDEETIRFKMRKSIFSRYNSSLSEKAFSSYSLLAQTCKKKGIVLIGFTPPFNKDIQGVFDSDPVKYQIWHEFQDASTAKRLKKICKYYYNFSRFEDTGSQHFEMLDIIHPSEKIAARMVIKMLEDPEFRKLFPLIDTVELREAVELSVLPCGDLFKAQK